MAKKGGFPGGMGMPTNMTSLMKQAQKMQKQTEDMQVQMDNERFEATSGGGAIKAVVTGKKELIELKINPEAVDPDDVEMLEDMIKAAVNAAIKAAEEKVSSQMGQMTGGINIPGLF